MDDARLQLLLDRAEISDVQLRYATGLDSRDWPLFRSCFRAILAGCAKALES